MEPISKTQKKKEALALQALGERLVALNAEQLKKIALPADLYEAVVLAKTIKKFVPLQRQMQYIGALMRRCDPQPIQDALQSIETGRSVASALHKQVEEWRDRLIAGDDRIIEEVMVKFPRADKQQVTDLVHKAREERAQKKPSPTASRALFRFLYKAARD